jgi:hypothetical protein
MKRACLLGMLLVTTVLVSAEESVSVPGTKAEFPVSIEAGVDGKMVKMVLTGTALRRRYGFNIYAMGSYVEEGAKIQDPEALIGSSNAKILELDMQRNVGGRDMADAFLVGIRLNHAEPAFTEEIKQLQDRIEKLTLDKGERVVLTNVPGVGLHCNIAGKVDLTIKNPEFSQAIWEIYFGKNNLGEKIRKGLVSRI